MKRTMKLEFYEERTTMSSNGVTATWKYKKCWRWRLTAPNGRIVLASTEGYARKSGAKRNWETIARAGHDWVWAMAEPKSKSRIEVINGQ